MEDAFEDFDLTRHLLFCVPGVLILTACATTPDPARQTVWLDKDPREVAAPVSQPETLSNPDADQIKTEILAAHEARLDAQARAEDERRQARSEAITSDCPPAHVELAHSRQIVVGMSDACARLAWGEPERVNRTVLMSGVHEQWVYGRNYVYFTDGVLTSYQTSQ